MPYRASIGGAFGGGAGAPQSHPIDIGGAIDALTGGASTLIQNAYMRKQGAAKLALEQQQRDTEAQRYAQQNARETERDAFARSEAGANHTRQGIQDAFAREKFDTEMSMAQQKSDREFLEKNGTPGRTTITQRPEPQSAAPPIAQSFQQGNLSVGSPSQQSALTTPIGEGSLGRIPHLNVTSTPDSFGGSKRKAESQFIDSADSTPLTMDEQGHFYRADNNESPRGRVQHYAAPQRDPNPKYQIIKDDKTGNYSRVRVDGPEGPLNEKFVKSAGATAASGQTMAMLGRMQIIGKDLSQADPTMTEFEDPKSEHNIGKVGTIMAGAGTAALSHPSVESHGLMSMLGNVGTKIGSSLAQGSLNADPLGAKYRTYIANGQRVGLGLAELNPRPNNALIGMEQALSLADIGTMNPAQIKMVQDRRRNAGHAINAILKMNPAFVEQMQAQDPNWLDKTLKTAIETGVLPHGGNAPSSGNVDLGAPSTISAADQAKAATNPEFAAWLKKKGHTP